MGYCMPTAYRSSVLALKRWDEGGQCLAHFYISLEIKDLLSKKTLGTVSGSGQIWGSFGNYPLEFGCNNYQGSFSTWESSPGIINWSSLQCLYRQHGAGTASSVPTVPRKGHWLCGSCPIPLVIAVNTEGRAVLAQNLHAPGVWESAHGTTAHWLHEPHWACAQMLNIVHTPLEVGRLVWSHVQIALTSVHGNLLPPQHSLLCSPPVSHWEPWTLLFPYSTGNFMCPKYWHIVGVPYLRFMQHSRKMMPFTLTNLDWDSSTTINQLYYFGQVTVPLCLNCPSCIMGLIVMSYIYFTYT